MTMFEEGKDYIISLLVGDEQHNLYSKVISVEMPLIKIGQAGGDVVINTHSPNFISAERRGADVDEAKAARRHEAAQAVHINVDLPDEGSEDAWGLPPLNYQNKPI